MLFRSDEIIRFRTLGEADIRHIVTIQVELLRKRMADRRIALDITDAALGHIAHVGYDPVFGARPLKRVIQREVADQVALLILEGKVTEGGTVHVDVDGDHLAVTGA